MLGQRAGDDSVTEVTNGLGMKHRVGREGRDGGQDVWVLSTGQKS